MSTTSRIKQSARKFVAAEKEAESQTVTTPGGLTMNLVRFDEYSTVIMRVADEIEGRALLPRRH